jgi:hypothetical protein
MKYIVTCDKDGNEDLFLFPRSIHHDAMAEMLMHIKNQTFGNWERVFREPISAGFVDGSRCHGKSESLGLESRPEDTILLKHYALTK